MRKPGKRPRALRGTRGYVSRLVLGVVAGAAAAIVTLVFVLLAVAVIAGENPDQTPLVGAVALFTAFAAFFFTIPALLLVAISGLPLFFSLREGGRSEARPFLLLGTIEGMVVLPILGRMFVGTLDLELVPIGALVGLAAGSAFWAAVRSALVAGDGLGEARVQLQSVNQESE